MVNSGQQQQTFKSYMYLNKYKILNLTRRQFVLDTRYNSDFHSILCFQFHILSSIFQKDFDYDN